MTLIRCHFNTRIQRTYPIVELRKSKAKTQGTRLLSAFLLNFSTLFLIICPVTHLFSVQSILHTTAIALLSED